MMTTAAAAGDGNPTQYKDNPEFKRKLSKREMKALKKQEKQNKQSKDKNSGKEESSVAEKLYTGTVHFHSKFWFRDQENLSFGHDVHSLSGVI